MSPRMKTRPLMGVIPSSARNLLSVLFLLPHLVPAQTSPNADSELTFSEFRTLRSGSEARRLADRNFFDLLAAQGREAAARQSLDRLAGWTKAAESRLAAQSVPLLDVEMLRFTQAQAEARVEQWEAERRRALAEVNRLLGRDPRSPLLALPAQTPVGASTGPTDTAALAADKFAARIARLEQLLPQAQDLLAKIYQNYLFGGVPLTTLLWQEEQTYQTELQYRLLLVEAEQSRTAGD